MKSTLIKFDEFEILATYKNVKYARLKIDKNSNITVSLPYNYPESMVLEFLETNLTWLKDRVKRQRSLVLPVDKTMLLGKIYTLKFDENFKEIMINDDEIYAPNLDRFMKFKKAFSKDEFIKTIQIYAPLIGREINKVTVRDMKTRFGSCNTKKGYINLALNLIEKSPELIECVVLHELAHLLYPHHQKSFYDFLLEVMPDYKEREKRLKNYR